MGEPSIGPSPNYMIFGPSSNRASPAVRFPRCSESTAGGGSGARPGKDRAVDFGRPERDVRPGNVAAHAFPGPLPESGMDPGPLLERTAALLFGHSLFNAHPRFFGYITAPPAPIGILGDFLAAAVNPNVGAWTLSPAATEIESQTVRWIAELIGYPVECGGLLVSGGNMANFACFLAARAAKAGWDVRERGVAGESGRRLRVYGSAETHTWIQKAADIGGLGTASIRWIPTDGRLRMDVAALGRQLEADAAAGDVPCLVVGTAGSVSTGAVDPLRDIAAACREYGAWFHVDGAYGGFAAALPDAPDDLYALNRALLDRLQRGGEAFVSNAVLGGRYVLRACIVNFHTAQADVEALPEIVARIGRAVDAELRPNVA